MENKLFAIWKYDLFPYILGGEVLELREKGLVKVKGYDTMLFKYEKLYPLEEGQRVYKRAMIQADNHNRMVKADKEMTLERIKNILKND